jgi:hypothetical protein
MMRFIPLFRFISKTSNPEFGGIFCDPEIFEVMGRQFSRRDAIYVSYPETVVNKSNPK